MKHYVYIDERLLRMYFTQLPLSVRQRAHANRTATDLELEASMPPKARSVKRPLIPEHDEGIALVPYVKEHLREARQCGTPLDWTGNFIDGEFDVVYLRLEYRLLDGGFDGIFIAFPAEGGLARLKATGTSYIVLGDASNCWQARGTASRPQVTSTLERLLRVWDDIKTQRYGDLQAFSRPELTHLYTEDYLGFSGGRRDVFGQLLIVEHELRYAATPSRLKGICRVRDRLTRDDEIIVVLYPLFLEQL